MGKKTTVILDIDSPTRSQIRRALEIHREKQKAEMLLHRGIIMTRRQAEALESYCKGCGDNSDKYHRHGKIYFDEKFCSDCVEKWTTGN